MDYSKYRFTAVVDWIDLEVHTINRHPAWRIHEASAGAFSYVTGLDPATGVNIMQSGAQRENTPTSRFLVRVQNPPRFAAMTEALSSIEDRDPEAAVTVRSIEVSLDAYRRPGTTDEQLAEMAGYMLRGVNRPEGAYEAPRFFDWRGLTEQRHGRQAVESAILRGRTAMYGNADDPYIVRGYLKNYDTFKNDNGTAERRDITDLLQHRARVEVRLQGTHCPVATLNDLRNFQFQSLGKFFKFREPTNASEGVLAIVVAKMPSFGNTINGAGEAIPASRNRGRSRKSRPHTKASALNERARDQLRKLSCRWIFNKDICDKNSGADATVGDRRPPPRRRQPDTRITQ